MAAADTRTTETGTMTTTTTEGTTTAMQNLNCGYNDYYGYEDCRYNQYEYGWKDVKEEMNVNNNKTITTNNTLKECFNAKGNEELMETERNYQNKLGANRYIEFSDDNDDNWNTHVSQYVERKEKPERMRKNGRATKRHAPKGEGTNRYLPYKT